MSFHPSILFLGYVTTLPPVECKNIFFWRNKRQQQILHSHTLSDVSRFLVRHPTLMSSLSLEKEEDLHSFIKEGLEVDAMRKIYRRQ